MSRPIPQVALDMICDHEKLVKFCYDDAFFPPREAKVGEKAKGCFTAGFGHTGIDVYPGMTVTYALAVQWLQQDLATAAKRLEAKIGADVVHDLTTNQYAALLMFVFNTGTGNPKKKEWAIWGLLRKRAFDQVPIQLARFVNDVRPDGTVRKLDGLVKRRNAEIALWATAEPNSEAVNLPSSVTRREETPPTPVEPPASIAKNPAVIAGAVGMIASAQPAIDQISKVIQPYSEHNDYVQKMYGFLMLFGAVCAAASVIYLWLQHRKAQR